MSEYYDRPADIIAGSRARSAKINEVIQSVEDGFDALPVDLSSNVTLTGTETLTNKTLTSPIINSPTGIVKADVGLSEVDNTSDSTKNAASVTLTNKILTAPVINSPTGIVKADIGLANVDNTSDTTKNAAVATLTNKTISALTNEITLISDRYYPNYSATDQGLTGDSDTLKYYVDLIGSDITIIHLLHNSGAATTEYILSTSETISDSILLLIDPGAYLTIATGITLTFANGLGIVAEDNRRIFNCVGTGAVAGLKKARLEWWQENTTPGTTDMSTAMQLLINSLPTDVQTIVPVVGGTYGIGSGVHIDRPVLFECAGFGEITALAASSGDLGVTFVWLGAGAGIMFTHSAQTASLMTSGTTTGDLIFGGGIDGAVLSGSNLATTGAWVASTVQATWKVQVRQFTGDGVISDGGNGALATRNTFEINVIYGAATAVQGMNGLTFREFNSYSSTQNTVERVWGLVYNGNGVNADDTDNNLFWHIHVVTLAPGTGKAINFGNGITNPGRNNFVVYVNGDVHAESNTRGNRLLHINSENTSVTKDSGATIHYDVIDYVESEIFQTRRYVMTDEASISGTAMRPDGTYCTLGQGVANYWGGMLFSETNIGSAQFNIPTLYNWNDGDITGIDLFYISLTANTSATAVFRIIFETATHLSAVGIPDADQNFTVTIADAINTMRKQSLSFSTAVPFTAEDSILGRIDRLPADVNDTASGNILLIGITVRYVSDGPNSSASGPFE